MNFEVTGSRIIIGSYSLNIHPTSLDTKGEDAFPTILFRFEAETVKLENYISIIDGTAECFQIDSKRKNEFYIGSADVILSPTLFHPDSGGELYFSLVLPLTRPQLSHIEHMREDSIFLKFRLNLRFAVHRSIGLDKDQTIYPVVEFSDSRSSDVNVRIPKSDWVDKLLPMLGFGRFDYIELRFPEGKLPNKQLRSAHQFYKEALEAHRVGDYPSSIGTCRKVLEKIVNVRKFKWKEEKPTFVKKAGKVIENIGEVIPTKRHKEYYLDLLNAAYKFTSYPHHSSTKHQFDKNDSSIVIHMTGNLLGRFCDYLSKAETCE